MKRLSRLEVYCPDGTTSTAKILLDGKPLDGVTRVAFDLAPGQITVARIAMYVDLAVDMRVVERVFEQVIPGPPDTP